MRKRETFAKNGRNTCQIIGLYDKIRGADMAPFSCLSAYVIFEEKERNT